MELDAVCLRWAKVDNLERLARALRVCLPPRGLDRDLYHQRLVRVVVRALDAGAKQPAVETRR